MIDRMFMLKKEREHTADKKKKREQRGEIPIKSHQQIRARKNDCKIFKKQRQGSQKKCQKMLTGNESLCYNYCNGG